MNFSQIALLAVVASSVALMLLRPKGIAEVWWVGGGAILLVVIRLIPAAHAVHAVGEGADVYFFLGGMMLLSELAKEQGVFDWLSTLAVRRSGRSRARLFTLIYGVGIAVTILLSNDATAVVLTPAILAAVKKAKVPPLPHLFVCAFIANAASFVLPISNPANLVVFHEEMPPLFAWLRSFALPSALSIAMTYLALRVHFRRELQGAIDHDVEDAPLTGAGTWVVAGLGVTALVLLLASALDVDLGLPTLGAALVLTSAVSWRTRRWPWPLLREISWSTLLLVAALFVLVDAVESVGALDVTRSWLTEIARDSVATGAYASSFAIGVANNVVNNLPLGLLAGATLRVQPPSHVLRDSILIGVDLGPNLSITGSLATILWLLALRKGKIEVGFWSFLKVGAVVMPMALAASISGVLLLHALGVS